MNNGFSSPRGSAFLKQNHQFSNMQYMIQNPITQCIVVVVVVVVVVKLPN